MRISDWISDVCSSDLVCLEAFAAALLDKIGRILWLDTNIPGHLVVSDAERRILYSPRIEGKPVVAEIPIGPNSKAVSVDSDAGYLIEQLARLRSCPFAHTSATHGRTDDISLSYGKTH